MPEEEVPFTPATEQPFADKSEPVDDNGQPDEPADQAEQAEPEQVEEPENDNEEGEGEPEAAEGEEAQESAEDDLEEFEFDGQLIMGPKGLKEAVMKNADYTQKTQEVAERRKELESFEQSLRARSEATEAELNLRAEVWAVEAALKQYENIDWAAWLEQAPDEAQKARFQYDDLRRLSGDTKQKLEEAASERSQYEQQDFAKRVGQTREYAEKHIKGFSPDMEKRVIDFALEQGITEGQLQSSINPAIFDILHKAMIGAETLKNPATPPQKKAVPLKTVSSRSNAPVRKSLSDMSMDEYVKARAAQGYDSG